MRVIPWNFRARWVLVTAVVVAAGLARAQDAPQLENKPLPLPEKVDYAATTPPPPGIVTEEPYVRWTKHRGTAEEAVARIVARFPDGRTRATTGLSVRCDGLILAPLWLRDAIQDGASVTVAPGEAEGETLASPLPVVGRFYHNIPRVEYTIIKVNGRHLPCLPLLDAKNILPGGKARVYRAEPGGGGRAKAEWVSAKIGDDLINPEAGRKDRHALLSEEGKPPLTPENAPPGSVVVDEESGAALGVVLEVERGRAVFTSFVYFHDFTGELGLMADRATVKDHAAQKQHRTLAEINALPRGGGPDKQWQWVPGGPVRLIGFSLDHYRRNFRTDTVCVPGFFVGKYPVTRREYAEWANALEEPFQPKGPDAGGDPEILPNRPRTLTRVDVALRYARAKGARLPTEAEWTRAAVCRDYAWAYARLDGYDATLRRLIETVNALTVSYHTSFVAPPAADPSAVDDYADFDDETKEIGWHTCDIELRAGEDVSVFGVTNVVMNCPEYVLSTPALTGIAPKLFPARIDPLVSLLTTLNERGTVQFVNGRRREALQPGGAYGARTYYSIMRYARAERPDRLSRYVAMATMRQPDSGKSFLWQSRAIDLPQGQGVILDVYRLTITRVAECKPGFRLAR